MKQASILLLALATSASAAIVKTANYSLDFGTTAANASPYFTDSISGHNVTAAQAATVAAATGSVSPAGGGGVTVSGSGGIFANALPFGYTSDWGINLWIRPDNNNAGAFFQGKNANTGGYIGRNTDGSFGLGGVVTSGVQANAGTWYQVTMINHGGLMNYYINQVQAATGVSTVAVLLDDPMFAFGAGGENIIGNASYDHFEVFKFDSATDSLANVTTVMFAVPEPSVALLSGLGALALLRRRRN